MDKKDIDRINELAKKKKELGLTPQEQLEQANLRKLYLENFREYFRKELQNTKIMEEDGTIHPLKKREQ